MPGHLAGLLFYRENPINLHIHRNSASGGQYTGSLLTFDQPRGRICIVCTEDPEFRFGKWRCVGYINRIEIIERKIFRWVKKGNSMIISNSISDTPPKEERCRSVIARAIHLPICKSRRPY